MPWVKLDERFRHNPKAIRVGPLGRDLYVCGLQYCNENLTDGFICDDMVTHLAPGQSRPAKIVRLLLDAGLWTRDEGGYRVHDYLKYQPSAVQVTSEREYQNLKRDMYADGSLLKAVRERDMDRCRYCGQLVNWRDRRGPRSATYDHVDPYGGNTFDNLVVACRSCNSAKQKRTPSEAGMVLREPGQYQIRSRSDLDSIQNGSSPVSDPTRPDPKDSSTTLSGERPTLPNPDRELREHAKAILGFLNERTGRAYRTTPTNLGFIVGRLKSGASVEDCRSIVARKAREWLPDPKMTKYLRPETLFNATKFESYIGELGS